MNEWLNILIGLLFAGTGVLFFSLFITYTTRRIISAKWHYWNRKISLLFFLIPIFLIPNLFTSFQSVNASITFTGYPIEYPDTLLLTETLIQAAFIIWIAGILANILWFQYLYQQWRKSLKSHSVPISNRSPAHILLHKHMEKMHIRSSIEIVYCRINISPFIIGIFKPTIVLPMYDIPYHELEMIIKHELTHYKKKDLWIKRAMLLAKILHWYNPFIYILQKEINKWSEISCDEDVVINMSHAERKKYGETILNMIYRSNQAGNSYLLGTFFTTGQRNLKKRLMKMLEVKKVNKAIVSLSAAILFIIGSIGMASGNVVHAGISVVSEEFLLKLNNKKSQDVLYDQPQEEGGYYEITSVKKSDESKFSKDEWQEILEKIENNEIILESE